MNEEKIMEKLDKYGGYFERVFKKLDEQSAQLAQHSAQFERVFKKLDNHDVQLERIIQKTINHDDRLEKIEQNMVTKKEFERHTATMDTIAGLSKKKDEELTFVSHQVTVLRKDIDKVKPLVGLA